MSLCVALRVHVRVGFECGLNDRKAGRWEVGCGRLSMNIGFRVGSNASVYVHGGRVNSGFQLLAVALREASGFSFRSWFESGTRTQELASKLIYWVHCIYEFKFEESKR